VLAWVGEDPTVDRMDSGAKVAGRLVDEWAMLLVTRLWELDPNRLREASSFHTLTARFYKYLR
jgi:hypothetical protein